MKIHENFVTNFGLNSLRANQFSMRAEGKVVQVSFLLDRMKKITGKNNDVA